MSKRLIHRWVEMQFKPENINEFLSVFESSKTFIRAQPGCLSLQLVQNPNQIHIICTSSIWESEDALNAYRNSPLFAATWAKTKPLFLSKAQAHTYHLLDWQP